MFNKFIKQVYDLSVKAINALKAINEKRKELDKQYKADRITASVLQEERKELRENEVAVIAEYSTAINSVIPVFKEALAKYEAIDGTKVHDDAKIFNPEYNITLTKEQLQDLVKKHHDNAFMLQLIRKYCSEHKIFIDMPLSGKDMENMFNQFISNGRYCVSNPYSLQASMFEQGRYTPDFDKSFPIDKDSPIE